MTSVRRVARVAITSALVVGYVPSTSGQGVELSLLNCMTPGQHDVTNCRFDGPNCDWSTDFSNFGSEAVPYDQYQANPIPTSNARFVIEGGTPRYNAAERTLELPLGTIVSTTRFLQYGSFEAEVQQSGAPGTVTSFISYSNDRDEIDVELTGIDTTNVQTNWYYKGIQILNQYGGSVHGFIGNTLDDNTKNFHTYRVDWSPTKIDWKVNGVLIRSLVPDDNQFPNSPARISFGLWQIPLNSDWAGRTPAGGYETTPITRFKSIKVSCAKGNGGSVAATHAASSANMTQIASTTAAVSTLPATTSTNAITSLASRTTLTVAGTTSKPPHSSTLGSTSTTAAIATSDPSIQATTIQATTLTSKSSTTIGASSLSSPPTTAQASTSRASNGSGGGRGSANGTPDAAETATADTNLSAPHFNSMIALATIAAGALATILFLH